MITRIATINDVDRIREIAEITWPLTYNNIISVEQINYMLNWMYSKSAISDAIEAELQDFIVLEENHIIIGFAGIEHQYTKKSITRIHKLYVLPDKQGIGAGKKLIDTIIAEAIKKDSKLLHLNVNKANPAVDFYKNQGFIVDSAITIDIGNGFVMDDFIMVKAIA